MLNYSRCLAKLALYFKACPTALSDEKINEYLPLLRDTQNSSFSYFKHTTRLIGREDKAIRLPSIHYIRRYSHKIAITNYRIVRVSQEEVQFKYKNYRKGGEQQVMKLSKKEFVRRSAMHIVLHKFVRIRHYGSLSNRSKNLL